MISADSSHAGTRKFILWNPPLLSDLEKKNKSEAEEWSGRPISHVRDAVRSSKRAKAAGDSRVEGDHEDASDVLQAGDDDDLEAMTSSMLAEDTPEEDEEAAPSSRRVRALFCNHRGVSKRPWRLGGGASIILDEARLALDRESASASEAAATPIQESPALAVDSAPELSGSVRAEPSKRPRPAGSWSASMYKGLHRDRQHSAGRMAWELATPQTAPWRSFLKWLPGNPWPEPRAQELPLLTASSPEARQAAVCHADIPAGELLEPPSDPLAMYHQRLQKALGEVPQRKSAIVEAATLLACLVEGGMRTLLFCRVRRVAELVLQYCHERLSAKSPHLIAKVKSYRAGYLKAQRRAIERELFSGRLLGAVATNALELGIDIGSLDCVVTVGYPGSASSLWQQSGRAGRGGRNSVTIMVCFDSPIEQFFLRGPERLFRKMPEAALVDTQNPSVLRAHAICAAAEAPLSPWDLRVFGDELGSIVAALRQQRILARVEAGEDAGLGAIEAEAASELESDGAARGSRPRAWRLVPWVQRPSSTVSLRAIDDKRIHIVDASNGNRVIDEIEYGKAVFECFEGAMYMSQGVTYKVRVALLHL